MNFTKKSVKIVFRLKFLLKFHFIETFSTLNSALNLLNLKKICAIFVRKIFPITNDLNYQNHLQLKNSIRIDRNKDRENTSLLTICFDLQKVISCPTSFVYKSL